MTDPAEAVAVTQVMDIMRAAFSDSTNGVPTGNIIWKGCEAANYSDADDAAEAFLHAAATDVLNVFTRHRQQSLARMQEATRPSPDIAEIVEAATNLLKHFDERGYHLPSIAFGEHSGPKRVERLRLALSALTAPDVASSADQPADEGLDKPLDP